MEYAESAMNPAQEIDGVNPVMLRDLGKILQTGLVEIKILMNSYNVHNSMLYVA